MTHEEFDVDTLVGEVLSDAPAIGLPWIIQYAGGKLWVADAADDPALHVLDATGGQVLHSVGTRGEGPGEFARGVFGITSLSPDSQAVWAWDMSLKRLTRFEPVPPRNYQAITIQLAKAPSVQRVVWVGPERIVGIGASDTSRFVVYDSQGTVLRVAPASFLGPDSVPVPQRMRASNSSIRVCSRVGGGFAIAYAGAGRLEYYGGLGEFDRLAEVPYAGPPVFVRNSSTNEIQFDIPRAWYMDCTSTSRHVFALFSGRYHSKYPRDQRQAAEFVHVFGQRNGKLENVLKLDHPATGITIDPDGKLLFTTSLIDATIRRYRIE